MQNLAFSEVSDGSYCNSNMNSGTITCATNMIFMWQPVTTWWELFSSTQVHSSYIYQYAQKALSATLLILEEYIFIYSCIYDFCCFFYVNNEHIHKCFSKSLFAFIIQFTFSEIMETLLLVEHSSTAVY